jgi:hypothetical protein
MRLLGFPNSTRLRALFSIMTSPGKMDDETPRAKESILSSLCIDVLVIS